MIELALTSPTASGTIRSQQRHIADLETALTALSVAEATRDEAETRFTSLVKHIRDYAIFSMDLSGMITTWNVAAEHILGYVEAEIIGKPFSVIFTPEDIRDGIPDLELRTAIEGGEAQNVRWHVRKGGTQFWAVGIVTPTYDETGAHTGFSKILRDRTEQHLAKEELERAHANSELLVQERTAELRAANEELRTEITVRRQSEQALTLSEARNAAVIEVSLDAIIKIDHAGTIVEFNPAAEKMFGYSRADMLGKAMASILLPENLREQYLMGAPHFLATGETPHSGERIELTALRAGGEVFPIELVATRIPGGEPPVFVGFIRDISERKRSEAALHFAQNRLQYVVASSPAVLFTLALNGDQIRGVTWMSDNLLGVLGYSPSEALHPDWWVSNIHPEDRERIVVQTNTDLFGHGRANYEYRFRHCDGQYYWTRANMRLVRDDVGRPQEVVGSWSDCSEEHQLTAERDELYSRLKLYIERMPLAYLLSDSDFRYTRWNPAAERIFGYSEAEVLGKHPFETIVPPGSQPLVAGIFERLLAGDMNSHGVSENLTRDGRRITCEWINTPLMVDEGRFVGVLSLAQDITARREVEKAFLLRDHAIQAVNLGIIITDPNLPDNPIVYASPGVSRLTGYPVDEIVGRNCRFLQAKETDPTAVTRIREAVQFGERATVELLNYRKDGTPFWNELALAPVLDSTGRLTNLIGVQTDVTQRRSLEEQYRQAQKMEAFGQLAGGVAHDFNNLLTIISGYSELMLDSLPPADKHRGAVEEIHTAGERAALLTRQLLAFSRKQVIQTQVLDLNGIVASTKKMLERLVGEDVKLTAVLASDLDRVKADPGQIEQVIVNLVVNARDAMPQGGRITLETANAQLDGTYVQNHAEVVPGKYLLLAVSDTGCGMTEEVQRHIFEPFFTTKAVGKGTGLGLATVFGIVKHGGGHVVVYSEVGQGTTFKVYLPSVEETVRAMPLPAAAEARANGERILIVEDELAVRTLTRLALERQGYTVLEASNGEEALHVCERLPDAIHLLLTDVVMPQMGGRQLAEQLRALHPELRVLFVSGYTDDAVVRHGILEAEVAFLQKPFTVDALNRKVRALLDVGV